MVCWNFLEFSLNIICLVYCPAGQKLLLCHYKLIQKNSSMEYLSSALVIWSDGLNCMLLNIVVPFTPVLNFVKLKHLAKGRSTYLLLINFWDSLTKFMHLKVQDDKRVCSKPVTAIMFYPFGLSKSCFPLQYHNILVILWFPSICYVL